MHFLLNLEKFKFILKYTYLSLLHVSVFEHPQGACTDPELPEDGRRPKHVVAINIRILI